MTDINLLPWREKKREREKKEFLFMALSGIVFSAMVIFCVNYYALSLVENQRHRNQRLESEIIRLDLQIKEIKDLKKLRSALIARMNIVRNLQATRKLTVHLLDEVISILPDGIYLYQMSRAGNKVTLLGHAESNANISELMRGIERSIWTERPELTEIKRTEKDSQRVENDFKLSFIMKNRTMLESKT